MMGKKSKQGLLGSVGAPQLDDTDVSQTPPLTTGPSEGPQLVLVVEKLAMAASESKSRPPKSNRSGVVRVASST